MSDTTWGLFINGSATLMAISSVALQVFRFSPLHAFCWTIVGFSSGFLAKKSIGHYTFSRSIARTLVTIEDRIPHIRAVAFCIALIVSWIFPVIAALFAVTVGFCAGYFFRARHEA